MSTGKILILQQLDASALQQLEQVLPENFYIKMATDIAEDELKKEIKDAEIVIGQPPILLLQKPEENCPKLKYLQMTWAGTDMYTLSDLPFPKDRIMLANASGVFGMVMSQFVIGMVLSLMLRFPEYHEQQQNHIWERRGPIQSLDHAKVLIFGAGDIGTMIAKRLSGFDAYCIGVCRNTENKREYFHELCTLEEADRFLPQVDVVIGCIPNTKDTAGFMNEQRLRLMKMNAVLVNVGRGNFIDCMALDKVLKEGHMWGAALDVTNPEPLPVDHPLWNNPKCMITPHTTGTTFGHLKATEQLLYEILCDNLSRYCHGQEIKNRIY